MICERFGALSQAVRQTIDLAALSWLRELLTQSP
jgi:hypothetical protein